MTETPRGPFETGSDADVDWEVSDLPLEEVRGLFVALDKALRAVQLYDENNPVYKRFLEAVRDVFRSLWAEVDRLQLLIEESEITWLGEVVYRNESRMESLAFLFFKDGIREITFLPGIEETEIERLLGVLQRARTFRTEGEDLVTALWEEAFANFQHHYVDLLFDDPIPDVEVVEPKAGEEFTQALRSELDDPSSAEEAASIRSAVASTVSSANSVVDSVRTEDFNPTLYSLQPDEMGQLHEAARDEMERDTRRDVLLALMDRLEEPEFPARQSEILEVLDSLLPSFLSRGDLRNSAFVLSELTQMRERAEIFKESHHAEIDTLLDSLSARESLTELVTILRNGDVAYTSGDLRDFFGFLQATAVEPLLRAAVDESNRNLRTILHEAVVGVAERDPSPLFELFSSSDPVMVAEAAAIAGRIHYSEAEPALVSLLGHEDARVRLAAIEAALGLKASSLARAIQKTLTDSDRDVRIAAARALGNLQYRPAEGRFKEIVTSKQIRQADLSEKIAFFESYGVVAGKDAVEVLSQLLNGRGFLGRRESSEIRACAALALGKIGTPESESALMIARSDDDPVVRNAVARSLRGEASGAR